MSKKKKKNQATKINEIDVLKSETKSEKIVTTPTSVIENVVLVSENNDEKISTPLVTNVHFSRKSVSNTYNRPNKNLRSQAKSWFFRKDTRNANEKHCDTINQPKIYISRKRYVNYNKKVSKKKFRPWLKSLSLGQKFLFAYIILSVITISCFGLFFLTKIGMAYLENKNYDKSNLTTVLSRPKNISLGGDGLIASPEGDYYIFHNTAERNYLYYSGNLYRVIKINNDGSIVAISNDAIGSLIYRTDKQHYKESEVYRWLNVVEGDPTSGVFYRSLYQPDKFLELQNNYCIKTNDEAVCQNEVEATIGLLSVGEYLETGAIDSFINNGQFFWTLSEDEDNDIVVINDEGNLYGYKNIGLVTNNYGIRPVVTFKANTTIFDGDGSEEKPYFIGDQEYLAQLNITKLNQRYAGEYVLLGDQLFRIMSANENSTKVIQNEVIGGDVPISRRYSSSTKIANMYNIKDRTSLAYYLNNSYYQNFLQKDLLVKGSVHLGQYTYNTNYQMSALYQKEVEVYVGIPMIGELYNSNVNNLGSYWCSTVFSLDGYMVSVLNNSNSIDYQLTLNKANVRPTLFISSEAIIESGDGTLNSPYIIK